MSQTKQYCTFFLNNLYFGIEVLDVQEVLSFQHLTRVPMSPPTVQGLINLRGQIVTVIDLRRRLDLPPREPDQLPINVVIRTADGSLSLQVDEIGDVVELDADEAERPPDTVRGSARELVQHVYKTKDRLLLILDINAAVNTPSNASSGASTHDLVDAPLATAVAHA